MILLTGSSGFIGSHLLAKLSEKFGKDETISLTSLPINGYKYIIHNNYNIDVLKTSLNHLDISTVIHVGSFIPKIGSETNNIADCNSNIFNTYKLLDSLSGKHISKLIFISTVDVYGEDEIITEESPLNPYSLYGQSKLYCERMIKIWGDKNNVDIQILRIGHVYGPGEEKYKKIIPVTMERLLNGLAPQIWGNGTEIRSFIFVTDVVNAILKAIELNHCFGPINIVSGNKISIYDLMKLIQKIANNSQPIEFQESNKPSRNLYFNNIIMKYILCDEEVSLEAGLALEWANMNNNYNI